MGIGMRDEGSNMGRAGKEGKGMGESSIGTSDSKGTGLGSCDMGSSEGSCVVLVAGIGGPPISRESGGGSGIELGGIGGPGLLSTSPQERRSAPFPCEKDGKKGSSIRRNPSHGEVFGRFRSDMERWKESRDRLKNRVGLTTSHLTDSGSGTEVRMMGRKGSIAEWWHGALRETGEEEKNRRFKWNSVNRPGSEDAEREFRE